MTKWQSIESWRSLKKNSSTSLLHYLGLVFFGLFASFIDTFLRLISLAYIFSTLTFYAFILPLTYCIWMFAYVTYKVSLSFSLANITYLFVSYVTSALNFPNVNFRESSKFVFNNLVFIGLTVTIPLSFIHGVSLDKGCKFS